MLYRYAHVWVVNIVAKFCLVLELVSGNANRTGDARNSALLVAVFSCLPFVVIDIKWNFASVSPLVLIDALLQMNRILVVGSILLNIHLLRNQDWLGP
jgi:hypothetical protein